MHTFAFYIMNKRGLEVITSVIQTFSAAIIEYAVISRDSAMVNDYYSEIVEICDKFNVKYFQRNQRIPNHSGYKFAIGWRWIIEDSEKLIVLHDSILPKYRGFSPLVNMLINNEQEIGVTALEACEEYDTGSIISQKTTKISYPIKICKAIEIVTELYCSVVVEIIQQVIYDKKLDYRIQDEEQASYSLWREEGDYKIDWNKDSNFIQRFVDALGYPYKGAVTRINDENVIINDVKVLDDVNIENRDCGKIIFIRNNYPVVVCGQGLIEIRSIETINGESLLGKLRFRTRFV